MKDILEKGTILNYGSDSKKYISTKERALELTNFKCYACDSTPINSRLILHFDSKHPKECYVMCSDCHDGSERRNQIKQYVKFLKEKIKLESEELSKANKYIVECVGCSFSDDEVAELVPNYLDYLEE